MLIARAHVHMDFRRVKGCQYKYSGHVVNFMQNTAKIINRLPSLPTELQVVILKPSSSSVNDSAVHREFAKTFRVQRKNVEMWLEFLVNNHPDYKDVVIDEERLSQLPYDETVIDAFSTMLHDEVEVDEENENVKDEATTNKAMINDAIMDEAMIDEAMVQKITIQKATINEATINEATVRKTTVKKIPINETTVSEAITANEAIIHKATTANKAKNDANMYDKHIDGEMQHDICTKKEENTSIQEVNPLGTLNFILKLNPY